MLRMPMPLWLTMDSGFHDCLVEGKVCFGWTRIRLQAGHGQGVSCASKTTRLALSGSIWLRCASATASYSGFR